ncbi:2-polyprenyl-6-methoxyphenol hydroxylase-like FAD-dependent oxidoreductase [Pedobacter sp. AK013]|uniref:FAD-dependent oxidoreductase n=1 Tax=Pedobacter sp. AK013 TaxID=2723071 RepID=UPI00161418B8|nr:NAD(P)/FAD-dependent oxidoreductase [Pedobacter sp. AK013]MBB6235901.1 2-polyprenyl-6-methoxyphenol hydroxylase-like FAD-dependent oxidoreductase [Pedobacter sp. AK013]
MEINTMNEKKILIVGSGIAGPALAIKLIEQGAQVKIIEARSEAEMNEGLFFGISPNGLNILSGLIDISQLYEEYVPGTLRFYNAKGKRIAELDASYQKEAYGVSSIQVKRSAISNLLKEKLISLGVQIEYGCKLMSIEYSGTKIVVETNKGKLTGYDLLIGADGIHSRCRKLVFPDAPKPVYTKMLSTGAIVKIPDWQEKSEAIEMTFGREAFFGYSTTNTGKVWWFNNYDWEKEPNGREFSLQQQNIKEDLLELHQKDYHKISQIIDASSNLFAYPIYDMPALEKWHTANVCLIGDAAHAISPHTGQGASLALEDSAILAKCLTTYPDPEFAFSRFQQLRSGRVAKVIAQARKIGRAKSKPNPIANFFRDIMLKYFINMEKKKMHWVYSYDASKEVV